MNRKQRAEKSESEQTVMSAFFLVGGSTSASLSLDDAADALDSLSAIPRLLPGLSLIASR